MNLPREVVFVPDSTKPPSFRVEVTLVELEEIGHTFLDLGVGVFRVVRQGRGLK